MKLAAAWKVLAGAGVLGAGLGGATAVLLGSAGGGSGDDSPQAGIEEPESQPADEPSGGIDYNCNLPGQGFPWLVQAEPDFYSYDPTNAAGIFKSTVAGGSAYVIHLPVTVHADGKPRMDEVYQMLCRVHPQLGGTAVAQMNAGQLRSLDADWGWVGLDIPEDFDPGSLTQIMYTDNRARGVSEAHVWSESIRLYVLPPMPQALLDQLTTATTTATTTSTTKAAGETQRWRVSLTGYEISDRDPTFNTGKYAVRFRYTLQADFTLVKRDGSWTFGTSTMTSSTISASELYDDQQWELQPLQCRDCEEYARSGKLFVDVNEAGVRFSWGVNPTRVTVQYRRPCVGPSCTQWLSHHHSADTFFGRVSGHRIPLKEFEETWTYTSSAGDRWVAYTYKLTRLSS